MLTRSQTALLCVLLASDWLLGLVSIAQAPAQVPVHWNLQGKVDRYGSPWELGLLFPIILTLITALLLTAPHLGTLREALIRSGTTYGRIALVLVLTLIGIHAVTALVGRRDPLDAIRGVWIILGLMWMAIGNWSGKIRRNALLGIRTPWTLRSDFVWERTQRLGGRLAVAHGLAILCAGVLLPVWTPPLVFLAGAVGLVCWAIFYSRALAKAESANARPGHPNAVS
ncbi:MAG: SdpI family protein [Planctomycetaceae bacterium]|nr:SdpI family protein [Planctomycetaceae bacterium]